MQNFGNNCYLAMELRFLEDFGRENFFKDAVDCLNMILKRSKILNLVISNRTVLKVRFKSCLTFAKFKPEMFMLQAVK